MVRVLLSLIIVAVATTAAQAVHPGPVPLTTASFQAILDTTGGGGTYVDLDLTNTPLAAPTWGFPDFSDAGSSVNGNVADDKTTFASPGPDEIAMTLTGLTPSTPYNIGVVIFGKTGSGNPLDVYDVAVGYATGVLTNYDLDDGIQLTSFVFNHDPDPLADEGLFRIPAGGGVSDGAGNLVVYLGSIDGTTNGRTEIDGLIYSVVPEPSTALLAVMGLLGLFYRGKRRYI